MTNLIALYYNPLEALLYVFLYITIFILLIRSIIFTIKNKLHTKAFVSFWLGTGLLFLAIFHVKFVKNIIEYFFEDIMLRKGSFVAVYIAFPIALIYSSCTTFKSLKS